MATSTLASLAVSLEANIAKFSTDMRSAADVTQRTMTGIQDSIGKAKSAFLGLAASVVSVGAAVQSVKGAIQLGDELKQMADATGIAVEKLDQLSIVAKLNGAGLEDIAKGFKGLGKAMIESQDSASKSAQLFSALGVAVKDSAGNLRGVDDVMGDVAKALNSIENETTRAAVGTAIFGKSYLQIAATLRNYEADQKAANEVLERFGGVSQTAANLADELGDKFTLLGEGSKRALLGALVPGMAAVVEGLNAMLEGGGRFQSGFGQVISWLAENATKVFVVLSTEAKRAGMAIGAAAAAIATGSLEPFRAFREENQKLEADFSATMARISTAAKFPGLDNSDAVSRAAGAQDRLNKTQADGAKLAAILGGATKGAQVAIANYADEIQKLENEMARLGSGQDGAYPRLSAAIDRVTKDLLNNVQITNAQIDAFLNTARAADELANEIRRVSEAWAAYEKDAKSAADAQQAIDDAIYKSNLSIKAQNDALKLEHDTLGLSANAREVHITMLQLEAAALRADSNAVIQLVERLDLLHQQAQDNALLQMAQQAQQAFQQATAFASDFFVDLFNNGSSAFKNLWENFKQMAFRAFADLAAKQVVISLIGAVGLGAAGSASASEGGLLSGLGSLLGSFGGGGGAFGSGAGAGLSAGIETIKLAATAGLDSVGGLAGVLGAASSFLPIAGIGAAIAIPLFSKLFGGSKPPKEGGFAESGIDAERFYKQSQFDDSLAKSTSAMVANFDALNRALGGSLQAGFAQGLFGRQGKDKEGTTAAFVGGQEVFRSTAGLGKDEASITAALQLESKRAILAALQASDIAPRFAEIIDSVAAAGASAGDIDRVLGLAQTLQMVETALGGMNVSLGETGLAAAEAAQQLVDAAGGADQFAAQVAAYNETFLTESERLDSAFASLKDSFGTIGVTMPASVKGFRDLVDSLDLTTEAGRSTWSALMNVAPAFASVTNAVNNMVNDIYSLQDSIHGVSGGDSALRQLNSAIAAFVAAVPGFAPLLAQMGTQGFAANLANIMPSDLANYTPSNIALIQSVLSAYNNLLQAGTGGGGTYYPEPSYPSPTMPAGQTPEEIVAGLLQQFSDLTNQSTGNYGERLALQIRLATGAMNDAANRGMPAVADLLRRSNTQFQASLALFDDLSGRYTDQIAEQLVKLTESYNTQAQSLQGNAVALDVLNVVFGEQWESIINGTAAGVDGTMDQLRRLQEGILDYVDSLKLSADSPLTATQKLEEARAQYEATLTRAGGGDQKALGDITGIADAYIKLARDFYASSGMYTDLFNRITGDLTALGSRSFGGSSPAGTPYQQMSPQDYQDASEFMARVGNTTLAPNMATDPAVLDRLDMIYEALLALGASNADDTDRSIQNAQRIRDALTEALEFAKK